MDIEELRGSFVSLLTEYPTLLEESYKEIKPMAEDQVIGQLAKGQRGDGSFLPNYSPMSVRVFGKRPGPMTLHDKGDFWIGVTLTVDRSGIEITDPDWKTAMLQLRLGDSIIELSEPAQELLKNDYIEPIMQDKVLNFMTR